MASILIGSILLLLRFFYALPNLLKLVMFFLIFNIFSFKVVTNTSRYGDLYSFIPNDILYNYILIFLFITFIIILQLWLYFFSKKYEVRAIFDCIILGFIFLIFSLCLIFSDNFILTFVAIAGINIIIYTLLGYIRTAVSCEAASKYWSLGVVSMAFFLLGSFILFCEFGSCDYSVIGADLVYGNFSILAYLGFFFIILTFFFKLGIFPLSNWVADVYDGASVFVLCLLVFSKFSIMVAFLNVFYMLPPSVYFFKFLIFLGVVGSSIVGGFGAVLTQRFKRFLAYSGMVHISLALSMLLTTFGLNSFFVIGYTLFYCFSSFILILLGYRSLRSSGISGLIFLTDIAYSGGASPFFFLPVIIIIFNFAGLPPTLGFFFKMIVFFVLAHGSSILSIIVLFFLLAISLVTTFNYLRVLKVTFFEKWWVDNFLTNLSYKILNFNNKSFLNNIKLPKTKLLSSEFNNDFIKEFIFLTIIFLIYIVSPCFMFFTLI